jgi:hypothetical protein
LDACCISIVTRINASSSDPNCLLGRACCCARWRDLAIPDAVYQRSRCNRTILLAPNPLSEIRFLDLASWNCDVHRLLAMTHSSNRPLRHHILGDRKGDGQPIIRRDRLTSKMRHLSIEVTWLPMVPSS